MDHALKTLIDEIHRNNTDDRHMVDLNHGDLMEAYHGDVAKALIHAVTVAPPPISLSVCDMVEECLSLSDQMHVDIGIEARPPVSVWKGDITILGGIDVIVNAANSAGLGCFRPFHRCIDNAIHSKAGPRLRNACHERLSHTPNNIGIGEAIITPAFCLPCSFVLHTVGPCLPYTRTEPTQTEIEQLRSCYTSCLNVMKANGLKSIAFCCISTGVFRFPQSLACDIAVQTVTDWLHNTPDTSDVKVVFNVFSDEDNDLYVNKLKH